MYIMGYSGYQGQVRDGQAIDICGGPLMGPRNSAAETLHLEQHKYPGDGSSRMVQGYGFIFSKLSSVQALRRQAVRESTSVGYDPNH